MSDVTTDTMMHSVAAGIAVDIAEEGFDRVSALLAGIPGGANRAVGSALARAAAAGKTVAKRAVGLEARVPFADTRIMQFMYNVPWKMKSENGVEKSLLRNAMKGLLPDEVLFRKKSPYPKTYDPHYEKLLAGNLIEVIEDTSSPVNRLVDKNKVYAFINEKKDYGKPWYGQLMAGPQMLAYLLQINYWLRKFNL